MSPVWVLGMLTEREKLAWAAGFVDGEGSIVIASGKNVRLTVGQVHKAPLVILQEMFGGYMKRESRPAGRRDLWVWAVASRKASNALRSLFPFLVVKRHQALLALQFQSEVRTGLRTQLTDAEKARRQDIKEQISSLNHMTHEAMLGVGAYSGIATYWDLEEEARHVDTQSSTSVEYV